jgi:DNA-binding transcriptional LysR family regulator
VIKEGIELRQLVALVAVADAGSFRAAARSLDYTQSAISHQIATLERSLGTPVFARPGGRRQIRLTPIGELTYRHARMVLDASNALKAEVKAAVAGERGTLRIGISQSTGYLLAGPLAALRRENPGIDVSLVDASTGRTLVEWLVQGRLDVGLYVNVEPDDRVATIPLFDDTWMLIARHDEPAAREPSVGLDVVDGVDMIAWHNRWRAQTDLERLWRERGIKPRIVYRTDDNLMMQRLVAAGLGVACVGGLFAGQLVDPELRTVTFHDELPRRALALHHARDRRLSPAVATLIDAVRATMKPSVRATGSASSGPV